LTFLDNECGIATHDLPRIFQKGFTGSKRRKGSTGMGLFFAKKLCDLLHLAIQVDSLVNSFTCVKIIFPIGEMHIFEENLKN